MYLFFVKRLSFGTFLKAFVLAHPHKFDSYQLISLTEK